MLASFIQNKPLKCIQGCGKIYLIWLEKVIYSLVRIDFSENYIYHLEYEQVKPTYSQTTVLQQTAHPFNIQALFITQGLRRDTLI